MRSAITAVVAIVGVFSIATVDAQQPDSQPSTSQVVQKSRRACGEVKAALAVQEVVLSNLVVNRLDAWVFREEWAGADFESWANNLRLGWEWDENGFQTNMFGHPFHGSMYFNAGRANCLSYWESVPLAFMGSFTWEFFGETYRPALNDFFMTAFGGIALGEMTHRVGATIRDNRAHGPARIAREIGALVFDPVGGLNRLFRGEWTRDAPNPTEHDPGAFFINVNAGVRALQLDTSGTPSLAPTFLAQLSYGDPFERDFGEPFDVFSVRAQVSPGGGGLNMLRASGRLYQRNVARWGRRTRHVVYVNHRYDYINNPVYSFGQQSIEGGLMSRWGLPKNFNLRTKVGIGAAFLGALDAPYSGVGERTYDFGPGFGGTFELSIEKNGITYFTTYNRGEFVRSVSGAAANHLILFSGSEINIPISHGVGLGFWASGDARLSQYANQGDVGLQQFFESRLFLSWTSARPARSIGSR